MSRPRLSRSTPAPMPIRLDLQLGEVPLSTYLATSLLHELVKFILYTRGQTHIAYEHIRANLKVNRSKERKVHDRPARQRAAFLPDSVAQNESAVEALHDDAEERRRSSHGRRGRRVRLPASVKRVIKFVSSMDSLLGSLAPDLLHTARPTRLAVALGPAPHRPRELYIITFAGPDAVLPTHIAHRPLEGQGAGCAVAEAPAVEAQMEVEGGNKGHAAGCANGVEGQQDSPRSAGHQPRPTGLSGGQALLPLLAPDPAAAALACLSNRERAAMRRAMRSLVVAQTSVEAWTKPLRPTKMFLALESPVNTSMATGQSASWGGSRPTATATAAATAAPPPWSRPSSDVAMWPGGGCPNPHAATLSPANDGLSELGSTRGAVPGSRTGFGAAVAATNVGGGGSGGYRLGSHVLVNGGSHGRAADSFAAAGPRIPGRGDGAGFRVCGRLPYGADSAVSRALRTTLRVFITIRTGSGGGGGDGDGGDGAAAGGPAGLDGKRGVAAPGEESPKPGMQRPLRIAREGARGGGCSGPGQEYGTATFPGAISGLQLATSKLRLGPATSNLNSMRERRTTTETTALEGDTAEWAEAEQGTADLDPDDSRKSWEGGGAWGPRRGEGGGGGGWGRCFDTDTVMGEIGVRRNSDDVLGSAAGRGGGGGGGRSGDKDVGGAAAATGASVWWLCTACVKSIAKSEEQEG